MVANLLETQFSFYTQSIREEERTRIAREIHDELGQWLTALKIEAYLIKKSITDCDTETQQKLSNMIGLVMETERAVERLTIELRPCILNRLGLVAAIELQANEFEKRTGVRTQFTSGGELNPEKDISTGIFRVHQEALTNITRHANATLVDTILEQKKGDIILTIKDNGRGFNLNELSIDKSVGLVGMRERALLLNGELFIDSCKSQGTVVRLKVPIDREYTRRAWRG